MEVRKLQVLWDPQHMAAEKALLHFRATFGTTAAGCVATTGGS